MSSKIKARLDQVLRVMDPNKLAEVAYKSIIKNTPRQSGNAIQNTRLVGDTIEMNYPYAGYLDSGASKQAPNGMIEPAIKDVQDYVKRELGHK